MGTINVAIDGQADGKKLEFAFSWKGDRQAIQNSMDLVREIAKQGGVTPQDFAHATLLHLPKIGIRQEEAEQQFQMATIIFAVLTEAEKQIECPGPILDVVADQDITADIQIRGKEIKLSIRGEPGEDSAYVSVN